MPTSGKRYYKVQPDVLWREGQDQCEQEGTQLAIAYSAKDYEDMKNVMMGKWKDLGGNSVESGHCSVSIFWPETLNREFCRIDWANFQLEFKSLLAGL